MKIGIYDPYLDDIGGGEKYMMTIASCLRDKHEITVFWDNPSDLKEIEKRFDLDLTGVRITPNIFSAKVGFVERIFKSNNFNLIIFLSDGSIPFVARKLVVHFQQPFLGINVSPFEVFKIRRVNKFIVNSVFTKNFVDEAFAINSKVVYPPVVLQESRVKENIIFHVGRFRLIKGRKTDFKKQSFMISVFKKMVDDGLSGYKFILGVSTNDLKDPRFIELKNSTKGYPIVVLVNYDINKLWQTGARAKIYWHASGYGEDISSNPELAEHFGMSTVEAMSAGAVPVVFNAGGQREIVTHAENGFLWTEEEDLVNYTLNLIKEHGLWEKMSDAAIRKSKHFGAKRFCREIEEVIRR